jgi:hypothetical protein
VLWGANLGITGGVNLVTKCKSVHDGISMKSRAIHHTCWLTSSHSSLITHHHSPPTKQIHHSRIPLATYATDDNYSTINRRSSMHSKFSLKPFLEAAYHIRCRFEQVMHKHDIHKMHVSTLLRVDGSFNLLSYAA